MNGQLKNIYLNDYLTGVKTNGLSDPYVPNVNIDEGIPLTYGLKSNRFMRQNVYDSDNNAYDNNFNQWIYDKNNNSFKKTNNVACQRGLINLQSDEPDESDKTSD